MLTLTQQLEFCKKCTNRKMDVQQGILCKLTDSKPAFKNNCADFILDETVKIRPLNETITYTSNEIKDQIPEKAYHRLIINQNFPAAIITGLLSSLLGAAIWALITVVTGFQIGFMALGIGALVGFLVRKYGKGISVKFGVTGAIFAFFGCVLGNIFSFTALIADYHQIGFWSVFSELSFGQMTEIMLD